MFDYAKRRKYIADNPLSDMKITVRYKQAVKKAGNTQTYNTDELEALNKYLDMKYRETNQTYVVEHTKTNRDRFVVLVPQAKKLLEKLDMSGVYLFERNGERLRARQIEYVLEKYAQREGIDPKRSHKIRKTYASRLNAYGVPIDAIREQLGHSELSTTLSYIYNPLTEDETYSMISDALDGKRIV